MKRNLYKVLFNRNSTRFIAGLLLCSLSPNISFAETKAIIEQDFTLTSKIITSDNHIRLDWSIPGSANKSFKVYQKKPSSTAFQSISSTNLESNKQVKVLNVHPNVGEKVSFTTWDGENITIAKSGNLKEWMEKPNAENSKGYGKGVIEVTSVAQSDMNNNPEFYLKNTDGSWKYDVIYQGHWDTNNGAYPTNAVVDLYKQFILDGRGFLAGHDTIGWDWGIYTGLARIRDLFNIKVGYWSGPSVATDEGYSYRGGYTSTKITLQKKGFLTTYPWIIGEVGTTLTIPTSHSTSNFTFGDVWLTFNDTKWSEPGREHNAPANLDKNINYYLTTWNNTALIQTGHSRGSATADEQKLIANTLFYLNQLNGDTYLDDYSGQDVAAPDKPSVKLSSATASQLKFQFDAVKDNGSQYSYYVLAEDNALGDIYQSNTITNTITSGFKGFSIVIDQNPNTIPGNTVNHFGGDLTLNNVELNKTYYLHVKSIDNQGNSSDTYHLKVNTSKPLSPELTMSRENWGKDDASFKITQPHNKNFKIISISSSETQPYISKLKSLGYNIEHKSNCTDVDYILKYDLVIMDAYCWGVHNASTLKTLYDKGAKLITVGNDSSTAIYPITSNVYYSGEKDLSIVRTIKNEASYGLSFFDGGRDSSQSITGIVSEASVLYRQKESNNPAIIEIQNGFGGKWIHSQKILGTPNSESFDELGTGLIDYIMDSISQFHITDVQYSIDNGEWISYNGGEITITKEGLHTVSVRNIDSRGVYSDVTTKTIGIDKTSPYLMVSAPLMTTSRTVKVSLDGMGDSLSGIKNIRISNYPDFKDANGYTTVSGKTSDSLNITIPFISNIKDNYSTRTIYVELFDNAGNSKIVTCTTKYEAKAPQIPLIILPTPNSFFLHGEKAGIYWLYEDINNDGLKIPQSKAIVTFVNTSTNKTYNYTVSGTSGNFNISTLEDGIYSVSVEVFNIQDKSAISKPVMFRYNTYDKQGNINSIPIIKGTSIKYVGIVNEFDLPEDTYINGYIYYSSTNFDEFVETKKVEFNINDKLLDENVIKLPEKAEKIMVKYILHSDSYDKTISPILDNIMVYGR